MRRAPPQGLLQVMKRRARRADAHAQCARAKAIQRLRLEMVAQREERRFALERPAVMRRDRQRELRQQRFRFVEPLDGHDDLRGPRAREFVVQLLGGQQLGDFEITGRQVDKREPEFVAAANRREKVVSFRVQQMGVKVRAGAEDLRDIAIDQLAGPGLLQLIANGNLAPLSEEFADVRFGRVMRNPAHRDTVAIGQREIEQL